MDSQNFGPIPAAERQRGEEEIQVVTAGLLSAEMQSLRKLLEPHQWNIHEAADCVDALRILEGRQVAVLMVRDDVPGGGSKQLRDQLCHRTDAPNLIVCSKLADERLWAEVLNLGCYDLLSLPFEASEVVRIAHLGWLSWKHATGLTHHSASAVMHAW